MAQGKLPAPIARLRDELSRLPGIGPKTVAAAKRLLHTDYEGPEEDADD